MCRGKLAGHSKICRFFDFFTTGFCHFAFCSFRTKLKPQLLPPPPPTKLNRGPLMCLGYALHDCLVYVYYSLGYLYNCFLGCVYHWKGMCVWVTCIAVSAMCIMVWVMCIAAVWATSVRVWVLCIVVVWDMCISVWVLCIAAVWATCITV